jgi:3-oxoacyl-[acyl-carrier protein] reductase
MNVLITGASKGMGESIAMNMAAQGHQLCICARKINDLMQLKAIIQSNYSGVQVHVKAVDCSIEVEVLSFADFALEKMGTVDVLVNNVGVFKPAFILDEGYDALDFHMRTNVYAAYFLYKKLGPAMKERRKGSIFNICSVASKDTIASAGSYCVTKSALLSLNHIMRKEMMAHDVKVTAILPGSTLTNSWEGTSISPDEFIQPEDVALAIENVMKMSVGANVEEIMIRPLHGQI